MFIFSEEFYLRKSLNYWVIVSSHGTDDQVWGDLVCFVFFVLFFRGEIMFNLHLSCFGCEWPYYARYASFLFFLTFLCEIPHVYCQWLPWFSWWNAIVGGILWQSRHSPYKLGTCVSSRNKYTNCGTSTTKETPMINFKLIKIYRSLISYFQQTNEASTSRIRSGPGRTRSPCLGRTDWTWKLKKKNSKSWRQMGKNIDLTMGKKGFNHEK